MADERVKDPDWPITRAAGKRGTPLSKKTADLAYFFCPSEAKKILQAPCGRLIDLPEGLDLLIRELNELTLTLLQESFFEEETLADIRALEEAYHELSSRIARLEHTAFPIRPLPPDWSKSFETWIQAALKNADHRPGPGRPKDHFALLMTRALLEFFREAYAQKPSGAEGGPAVRFIQTYISEFRTVLERTPFWNPSEKKRILSLWQIENSAVHMRVRRALKDQKRRAPKGQNPADTPS